MSKILEVWRTVFGANIPEEQYETALMLADLMKTVAPSAARRRTSRPAVAPPEEPAAPPASQTDLSIPEAARVLGVSDPWVYQRVKTKKIPSHLDAKGNKRVWRKDVEKMSRPRGSGPRGAPQPPQPTGARWKGKLNPLPDPDKTELTAPEAGALLGTHPANVYSMVKTKKLPSYKDENGNIRIQRSDVEAYLKETHASNAA